MQQLVSSKGIGTMAIQAIIIDLGGVIINLDYELTSKAFEAKGVGNFNSHYTQHQQTNLFDRFETGAITPENFRKELNDALDISLSDEEFDEAWNALLLDVPQARLDYIKQLKNQGYLVFLLSNTNAIHYKRVFEITDQQQFSECFNKQYYSHEIGLKKPNQNAFERILRENSLNPENVLFVDDTIRHIQGAQALGISTLHISGNLSIFDITSTIDRLNAETGNEIEEESEKKHFTPG
jgi:putative hydrolase of the HAD superfamily